MRALHLGLLFLVTSAGGGCLPSACIQHGAVEAQDLCVTVLDSIFCNDESACGQDDLPISCDDYLVAATCQGEGFDHECGGIWHRVPCE